MAAVDSEHVEFEDEDPAPHGHRHGRRHRPPTFERNRLRAHAEAEEGPNEQPHEEDELDEEADGVEGHAEAGVAHARGGEEGGDRVDDGAAERPKRQLRVPPKQWCTCPTAPPRPTRDAGPVESTLATVYMSHSSSTSHTWQCLEHCTSGWR